MTTNATGISTSWIRRHKMSQGHVAIWEKQYCDLFFKIRLNVTARGVKNNKICQHSWTLNGYISLEAKKTKRPQTRIFIPLDTYEMRQNMRLLRVLFWKDIAKIVKIKKPIRGKMEKYWVLLLHRQKLFCDCTEMLNWNYRFIMESKSKGLSISCSKVEEKL